ncbi:hypothetical protein GALL_459170 [mine drainage metagenome]|uniref:Uncharacterized protein n=1 Tax=mine drainage metagenome TaxID=410659 RepID=A0A1J5Q4Q3_9ZZZZ
MGEIDQANDAIHHGIAQCDQGIHAAEHQAINDLLNKGIHKIFSDFQSGMNPTVLLAHIALRQECRRIGNK